MELQSLHIYLSTYPIREYKGTIKYNSATGSVELNLLPEHMQPLFEAVAEALVKSSKAVAAQLTAEVISTAQPLLVQKDLDEVT